ncbi:MAG: TolB-like 6-bladed beta-propeller domain-containing protein [Oscillibacter sp.]|nr:TolB-like 6-bladed beta-propeller domain-containing protein [Oscillibacter sp.]
MRKVFLFFMVFCACSNESSKYIRYDSFPQEKFLKSEIVALPPNLFCAFPSQIELHDSVVVILDRESPNRGVHKLTYPGFNWISSLGEKGRGEWEYIYLTKMDIRENELYLLDPVGSKFLVYDLNMNDMYPKRVDKFSPVSNSLLSATVVDDSVIVSGDINSKKFLLFQSFSGKLLDSIFVDEKTQKKNRELSAYSLYDLKLSCNHKDFLAAATKSGEVIYIYNTKTKNGNCIVGPNGFPDYGRTDDGHILLGKVEGFMDIKIYGDYIYAIFSGKFAVEAMTSDDIGGKYVYVFDKTGKPVIKYELDKEIISFCVDESRKILFGLEPNSENFIVNYKL